MSQRKLNVDGSPVWIQRQLDLGRVIWVRKESPKLLRHKAKQSCSISGCCDFGQLLLVQISAARLLLESVEGGEVA